jgi:hypothetical protein
MEIDPNQPPESEEPQGAAVKNDEVPDLPSAEDDAKIPATEPATEPRKDE